MAHSSFCSSSKAPIKRITAASLGKMPTTSLRRLISPLSRSSDRDDVMVAPCFDVSGIQPDIGPLAFDGAAQEGLHPLVDLAAQSRDLAFGDALHPHGPYQIVDRAG